jgi:hypothetical protein
MSAHNNRVTYPAAHRTACRDHSLLCRRKKHEWMDKRAVDLARIVDSSRSDMWSHVDSLLSVGSKRRAQLPVDAITAHLENVFKGEGGVEAEYCPAFPTAHCMSPWMNCMH